MTTPALGAPPEFRFGPVSRTDLVRYAGASGDFNPLHHDETYARAAGLPSVMAHGMFSAGLLGSFLLAWIEGRPVRRFKVRFLSPVWPGDSLSAGGEVVSTATKEGKPVALLALRLWRGDGSEVVSGEAEVECPEAQQGAVD
jgi:3-hydroxybutyryl-CoA dehydratase